MRTLGTIIQATVMIFLISCGERNGHNDRPKSSHELRAELKMQEEMSPRSYLENVSVTINPQVKQTRKGGLFRSAEYAPDGAIFEGNFINKATLAKFKDIRVKISYFSYTRSLIKEEFYVVYDYFPPNTTRYFSFRVPDVPQSMASFSFEIMSAIPTNE